MDTATMLQCRPGLALLPLRLFPEPLWYAVAAAWERTALDVHARFNKRDKAVHRYAIADVRGRLELTVPVVKPEGCASPRGVPWSSVGVSAHGRWWEVHRVALESAYGRTPFFEHYIGRFDDVLAERPLSRPESVADLCARADTVVRGILGLRPAEAYNPENRCATVAVDSPAALPSYWQVRADRLGHIPGLSILDLIFNLGPEAPLHLLTLQHTLGLR